MRLEDAGRPFLPSLELGVDPVSGVEDGPEARNHLGRHDLTEADGEEDDA